MTDTSWDRPWLATELSLDERVELLLSAMSTEEKVGQTHQVANLDPVADAELILSGRVSSALFASGATAGSVRDEGVRRETAVELQRMAREGTRLGIPLLLARDVIHGHRTVSPIPLGQAAGFDPDLVREVAALAALEARGDGIDWTFAPMMDISEDPRWGRVAECLGESPALASRLAAAMVSGFQASPDEGRTVAACMKHYVGYGMSMGGRDYDAVAVGENTLRNLHLRPFHAAFGAGALTAMAAFNTVDGIPMHAHERLVRQILKDEWGFRGLVVSDWNGIGELVEHGVAADRRDAARQALRAGIDMDMVSGCYRDHLAELVAAGDLPVELLDDAVRRVLRVKFLLGLFEESRLPESAWSGELGAAARGLARRAGHAAVVLLKNAGGRLPLSGDGQVLLSGPYAEEISSLRGTWCLDGRDDDMVHLAAALRERLGERLVVCDGRFSDLATRLARSAEVAVVTLGEHAWRSGENNSVASATLPAGQVEALREIAELGVPTVAVVITGRPLDLREVSVLADAVVLVFHPGTEGARAIADVLLGDAEPRGRLPMSLPRGTGHLPQSVNACRGSRPVPPGQDRLIWRYVDALTDPLYPFGFGLSYTDTEIGAPEVSAPEVRLGGSLRVTTTVTNTGGRAGRQLVQLYLSDPVAEVARPWVELLDWRWVDLAAGQTTTVAFDVDVDAFAYYGRDMRRRVDPGLIRLGVGPDSRRLLWTELTVVPT